MRDHFKKYKIPPLVEGVRGRSFALSIAGFDPCGGAGLPADIKVFEYLGVTGLGVVSALTYQNDSEFVGVKWSAIEEIKKQLKPLQKYPVKVVKIGLIESFEVLEKVLSLVRLYFGQVYVIWDPILKPTSGKAFHHNKEISASLVKKINLITPNYEEYKQLGLEKEKIACSVLVKGGHRKVDKGVDILISKGNETEIMGEPFQKRLDKHGTGCVLSSAIAGYIALGRSELEACVMAKMVVEKYITSNDGKLGKL